MNASLSAEHNLPTIESTEPVADSDQACLSDIQNVLRKHGKLNRFGVTLLHKHFPLADGEVMVESCDPASRTLTIKPVALESINEEHYVETCWRLDTGQPLMRCNIEVYHKS